MAGSRGARMNGKWEVEIMRGKMGQMHGGMSQRRKWAAWARPGIRGRACGWL